MPNGSRNALSKNDGHKIEEYLSSVRNVEKQIDSTLNPPAREWIPPTTPELVRPPAGIPVRRDEHVKMMMDLLVLALQTDTTRVGTFMLAHGFSRCNFGFMGLKGDHHTISHHKNQNDWLTEYTAVTKYYVGQYAYLMEQLQKIDEGGSNLLENSVVLFGSGLKDGNGHVRSNLPILLGGHGAGSLNPGRHIFSHRDPYYQTYTCRSSSDLGWISTHGPIAQTHWPTSRSPRKLLCHYRSFGAVLLAWGGILVIVALFHPPQTPWISIKKYALCFLTIVLNATARIMPQDRPTCDWISGRQL